MSAYVPPFDYTAPIVSLVSQISELVGKVTVLDGLDPNPVLRRENQIRTIHSSLLIENNALTLEQVTAVLNGKHVLAPPKDVREVQNAYDAYDAASAFDPYSLDDLLKAHAMMMDGLVRHLGCLRNQGVGVYAGDVLVHVAPPHNVVPQLMRDLFGWLGSSNDHPLIRASVFHYEFEFIHPFMDGNGRMGRLWHSLLLRAWRPVFAWLPVETLIHRNQQEYYDAIMAATNEASSTPFVEFMLGAIEQALVDVLEQQESRGHQVTTGKQPDATGKQPEYNRMQPDGMTRDARVTSFLAKAKRASAADIAELLGLSKDRTRAILRDMAQRGLIQKLGSGRATLYVLAK